MRQGQTTSEPVWLPWCGGMPRGTGHTCRCGRLLAAQHARYLTSSSLLPHLLQEPLPPESPLWRHPRVRVFPHVSGITNLPNAAEQMARVWAAVQAGQPLPQGLEIDRSRGY